MRKKGGKINEKIDDQFFGLLDVPINDLFVGNDMSICYIAFFKITTQNHLVESQGFNALSPMQATMKMLLVQL